MNLHKIWVLRIGLLFILFIVGPPLLFADDCSAYSDCFGGLNAAAAAAAAAGAIAGAGVAAGAQKGIGQARVRDKIYQDYLEGQKQWRHKNWVSGTVTYPIPNRALDWLYKYYLKASEWVGGPDEKYSMPAGRG